MLVSLTGIAVATLVLFAVTVVMARVIPDEYDPVEVRAARRR
ncbi:MAG TPA: hypothetical protein VJP88_04380 [Caulobacteraceae bacterium]|nr:hypothetical protein [Caulobacteraceae bacterium]